MSPRAQRRLLVSFGALLGLLLVGGVALALPAHKRHHHHHHHKRCLPYFLLPHNMLICGAVTVYINPDGGRVLMKTSDLAPMPKPPNRKEPA